MSLKADIDKLKGEMATAAQHVYDEWEQDEEGFDEECGSGGICDLISREIQGIISSNVPDVEIDEGGQEGDDHAYTIVSRGGEVLGIDIDPRVYESGGGYNWKKRKGIKIHKEDVDVFKANPSKLAQFAVKELRLGWTNTVPMDSLKEAKAAANEWVKEADDFYVGGDTYRKPIFVVVDDKNNIVYHVGAKIPTEHLVGKKIKNPGAKEGKEGVEELSKKWHGRDVESEQQVDEIETYDEDLAELADLEELGVLAADCKKEFNIIFKHDRPKLTSTVDGQLEIVGGDQELEGLNGGKRSKPIGWLIRVVYETDKHHLEDSNGYPEPYEHYFAEEFYKEYVTPDDYDTTDEWWEVVKANGIVKLAIKQDMIPMLVYDSVDHKLQIVGGVYSVEDVGIKN